MNKTEVITEIPSIVTENEVTPYVCFGVNSKMIYVEGSRAYINQALLLEFPSSEKKKIKGTTKKREIVATRLYIEPLKIRKADAYYAELDAEE